MTFTSVIFDWRGTLVTTLSWQGWAEEALRRAGREDFTAHVDKVLQALRAVDPGEARLDAPGVDCDADLHRETYFGVFADAGFDRELSEALYAVESDHRHNRFASDAVETLQQLRSAGVRVAVLSDVHFDIRPAFAGAGMEGLVDTFVLSFEQGVQKPDPVMFAAALEGLGAAAEDALMVGDRSRPDGAAVECGITTLLLPPLRGVDDRRLHRVLKLCRRS
ncbi:HAD-IA family hydrolase [Kineococcus sp. NUM-3379]